jgi:hypothetical protein
MTTHKYEQDEDTVDVYVITVYHSDDGEVNFVVEGVADDEDSLACVADVLHDVADSLISGAVDSTKH